MDKAIQIEYGPLFEYKCECAAKAGFDCIAVNYTQVLGKTEDEWKAITEDIARILDKTGLRCHQTHPHYYNLFISSEILEEEMEFNIRQSIISGSALGAKYHVIHPRTATSGAGYGSRTSLKDNLRWIGGLLDCAKKHGASIAVENLPIFPGSGRLFYFYSAIAQHRPYQGIVLHATVVSGRRGSNSRPIAWKAIALSTELLPHLHCKGISFSWFLQ